ncbi:hypothetical protein CLU79DRAFT_727306 [Phycomyces nitens]|nr:hypothetical protein CLU79DRAFT_727306 [Phycomyces nitens]
MSYFANKVLEIRNRKRNDSESSANGNPPNIPHSTRLSVNSKENKPVHDDLSQTEFNSQTYIEQLQQMANQPAFTNTPYLIDEQHSNPSYSSSPTLIPRNISGTQALGNGPHNSYIPSYAPLFSTSDDKKGHQASGDVQTDSFTQWNDIMEDASSIGDDNYDLNYPGSQSGISATQGSDQPNQLSIMASRNSTSAKVESLELQVGELSKTIEKLQVEKSELSKEMNGTIKDLEQQLVVLKNQLAKKQDKELQSDIYSNVFFIFYFIFYCMKQCFINGQNAIMLFLEGNSKEKETGTLNI